MSEKYSTGELIYHLTRWKEALAVEDDHVDAIIARLGAADRLVRTVKRFHHPNETAMQYLELINKAIADYEGEK